MSEMKIKGGTGSGFTAKVNDENRLVVEAVSSPFEIINLIEGRNFVLSSGKKNLSSGNESAILYFSHSEVNEFLLGRKLLLWSSESVGGTKSTMELKFWANATGMTGGADFTPIASSLDSTKRLTGTFKAGAEAATLDGSPTLLTTHIVPCGVPYVVDFTTLHAKDVSLGITIDTPPSNTDLDVSLVIQAGLLNKNNY